MKQVFFGLTIIACVIGFAAEAKAIVVAPDLVDVYEYLDTSTGIGQLWVHNKSDYAIDAFAKTTLEFSTAWSDRAHWDVDSLNMVPGGASPGYTFEIIGHQFPGDFFDVTWETFVAGDGSGILYQYGVIYGNYQDLPGGGVESANPIAPGELAGGFYFTATVPASSYVVHFVDPQTGSFQSSPTGPVIYGLPPQPKVVPEPSTLFLLGAGLFGLPFLKKTR